MIHRSNKLSIIYMGMCLIMSGGCRGAVLDGSSAEEGQVARQQAEELEKIRRVKMAGKIAEIERLIGEAIAQPNKDTNKVGLIIKESDKVKRLFNSVEKLLVNNRLIKGLQAVVDLVIDSDEIVAMLGAVKRININSTPEELNSLLEEIKTQQGKCVEKLRNIVQCKMNCLKEWLNELAIWRAALDKKEFKAYEVGEEAKTLLKQCEIPGYLTNGSVFSGIAGHYINRSVLSDIDRSVLQSIAAFDYRRRYTSEEARGIKDGVYVNKFDKPITTTIQDTRHTVERNINEIITILHNMIPVPEGVAEQPQARQARSYTERFRNFIDGSSKVQVKDEREDIKNKFFELQQGESRSYQMLTYIDNRYQSAVEDIKNKFLELSKALSEETDFTAMLELLEKLAEQWIEIQNAVFYHADKSAAVIERRWDTHASEAIVNIKNQYLSHLAKVEAEAKAKETEEKRK